MITGGVQVTVRVEELAVKGSWDWWDAGAGAAYRGTIRVTSQPSNGNNGDHRVAEYHCLAISGQLSARGRRGEGKGLITPH